MGPKDGEEAAWPESPYVTYSQAHGLPLDSQTAAGTSLDVLWDNRDSFINADHGWLAKASYRTLFDGFLGGDSSWQKLNLDVRTYKNLSRDRRHKIAFWTFTDLVVGGVAPFLDLPSTGGDTYGRSARGYAEGQFRGERLAYGEIEYRGTLMRNGLLGMVAFLNTTTVANWPRTNTSSTASPGGGGAGLRLLINKRSKTNLCLDFGFGKQGSKGRIPGRTGSVLIAAAHGDPVRIRTARQIGSATQRFHLTPQSVTPRLVTLHDAGLDCAHGSRGAGPGLGRHRRRLVARRRGAHADVSRRSASSAAACCSSPTARSRTRHRSATRIARPNGPWTTRPSITGRRSPRR